MGPLKFQLSMIFYMYYCEEKIFDSPPPRKKILYQYNIKFCVNFCMYYILCTCMYVCVLYMYL